MILISKENKQKKAEIKYLTNFKDFKALFLNQRRTKKLRQLSVKDRASQNCHLIAHSVDF